MVGNKLDQQFILITFTNFPSGGAGANYLNLFCKGLKINGYNIKVLLLKGFAFGKFSTKHNRKNITADGIPFSYLGMIARPQNPFYKIVDEVFVHFKLVGLMLSLVPKRKITTLLVYNNEVHTNFVIYGMASLFGVKIISFVPEFYDKGTFKGSFLRRIKWYGFLLNFKYLNKLSYKLIVFSHYLKDQYLRLNYKESDIFIQPNLTDFEYWKIECPIVKYTLGYSGTPAINNGLNDLFAAMRILKKEGINTTLFVIGDSLFGKSVIPELVQVCKEFDIAENVIFKGLVELDDVKKYLSECEILTLTRPSMIQTLAGFPTKLGEYFASGKKVIVTNFGDIEKYFKNEEDLVIAQSGDVEDIAKKIKWIIQNGGKAELLTGEGYKKARDMLEYKSSVNKIASFIESLNGP